MRPLSGQTVEWDTERRRWDSGRPTLAGLRPAALALVALCSAGLQLPEDTVCRVDAEGERTQVVSAAEARALLERGVAYRGPCALLGPPALLGGVPVRAFVQILADGTPYALGVSLPDSGFGRLPTEAADGYRCLDLDQDGAIDVAAECVGGHERVLFLPRVWEDSVDAPFQWILFNWNPAGHGPPGVWDTAHFDVHFFIQSLADRSRIRIGRCAMLVDCDDLEIGTRPVPADLLPTGYEDRGVVEFGMGNHLIDPMTFGSPSEPPTHTLVYGAWAGRVSFLEPMITRDFLERVRRGAETSGCYPVPQPATVERSGHHPTEYCIRWSPARSAYTVSLEGFRWRSEAGVGP